MAKDKELADHERAHSGKPGTRANHGQRAKDYSRLDEINDHREALGYSKFEKGVLDKRSVDRLHKKVMRNAPYGNDAFANDKEYGPDYEINSAPVKLR